MKQDGGKRRGSYAALAKPGPCRRTAGALRELEALDRGVYAAVATAATPSLDGPLGRLSRAANASRLWLALAAGLAAAGGHDGRRAALHGTAAIAVASAAVNLLAKSLWARQRPDRARAGVPVRRTVPMPASPSFPSGHAAAGFAFAAAVGRERPWLGLALRVLAGAVAYSRVHTGVHYPGDVIAGAVLGEGTGLAVASLSARYAPPSRHSDNSKKRRGEPTRHPLRAETGHTLVNGEGGQALQRQAHHRQVEPAAELGADFAGSADHFEAEALVEHDRRGVGGVDAGHHHVRA